MTQHPFTSEQHQDKFQKHLDGIETEEKLFRITQLDNEIAQEQSRDRERRLLP